MKLVLINILLFSFMLSKAQVIPLEDHYWKLEKVVTADSTLTVPNDVNFIGSFLNAPYYTLGACNPISGNAAFDDTNQSFNIIVFGVPFEPCFPEDYDTEMIDVFFQEEFLFDQPYTTTLDPFSYSFTTGNDKIYLDITNSEGSIATFYDTLLSQQGFENQDIAIYPNPSSAVVYVQTAQQNINRILIYNLAGQLVLKSNPGQNKSIDISRLQNGIYILSVETADGIWRKKLVKG